MINKIIIFLLLIVSVCYGQRDRYTGPTTASSIQYKQAVIVQPDDYAGFASLQAAYDWLASDARDGSMGDLTADNPRYLVLSAGLYDDTLTTTTDYVYIVESSIGSAFLQGTITDSYDCLQVYNGSVNQVPRVAYHAPRHNLADKREWTFQTHTDWVQVTNGDATVADDTTYFLTSGGGSAGSSTKLTCAVDETPVTAHKIRPSAVSASSAIDLSFLDHIVCQFYIYEGTGASAYTTIDSIQMYLYDDDGGYLLYTLWDNVDANGSRIGFSGWNTWTGNLRSSDTPLITYSTFDFSRIENLYLVVNTTTAATDTPSVSFSHLMFYNKRPQPYVIIRFDDGYDEQYEAACYLYAKGLRACFGIIGDLVGQTGFVTLDELKKMKDMGHLIVNHSWDDSDAQLIWLSGAAYSLGDYIVGSDGNIYLCTTPIVSAASQPPSGADAASWTLTNWTLYRLMDYHVKRNASWLASNGFGAGARIFIAPEGLWTPTNQTMTGPFLDCLWLSNDNAAKQHVHTFWNIRQLSGVVIGSSTGAAENSLSTLATYGSKTQSPSPYASATVENAMESAIADGGIFIPYFHYISDDTGNPRVSWTNYKSFIDVIATAVEAGRIKNITPVELLSGSDSDFEVELPCIRDLTASTTLTDPFTRTHIYTNNGAGGAIMLTLPKARKGTRYEFRVREAQELQLQPDFKARTCIYDNDGGDAPNYRLHVATDSTGYNAFVNVAAGDKIRITNTGAGGHLTAGEYTVSSEAGGIDATNQAYICLVENPADGSDDTGVTVEFGDSVCIGTTRQQVTRYITANAQGEMCVLECMEAGRWEQPISLGTWTAEP